MTVRYRLADPATKSQVELGFPPITMDGDRELALRLTPYFEQARLSLTGQPGRVERGTRVCWLEPGSERWFDQCVSTAVCDLGLEVRIRLRT